MTRLALERDRITLVALLLILIGGISAYRTLPRAEDPGFTIRVAFVMTQFPGASPTRVEELVTDKIEEVVQEIPELDFVSSQSRAGVSLVYVNIQERYANMRPIWDNLRRKIDGLRPELPEGVIGPEVNDEFADTYGIVISLLGEGYAYAELKEVADQVRDELLLLRDAAKVEIYGAQDERVFLEYSNARLAELGLSASQLRGILESQNILLPGGSVVVGDERIQLEPSGSFESVEDLKRTVIALPTGDVAYLEDLVTVRRGTIDPPRSVTRAGGSRCLVLGISMREGGNILDLGAEVDETIRRLESRYPIGVEFEKMADQPARVEKKIDEFVGNLYQAIGIVILVMLLTLGLRTGLVVASLIPSAMLMTLLVMSMLGVGLDQMSLASLIIALGMLIDNAIVMSESILVQAREGKTLQEAAIASGKELRVPLLTSSLTTAAAFLPFYLGKSTSSEYTGVIFVVVTITLLCSWVLALTMTPLLCVRFLKVPKAESAAESFDTPFYRRYRALLGLFLRRRYLTLTVVAVVFVLSLGGFRFLPVLFFPKSDNTFFTAKLELPTGSDIGATQAVVEELESFIDAELLIDREADPEAEGILSFVSFVGGNEPRFILTFNPEQAKPSYGFVLVNATSFEAVGPAIDAMSAFCRERFPGVIASIKPADLGPPVDKPIQVRISGRNTEQLFRYVDVLRARLESTPGAFNVSDDWGQRTKKLLVRVNQARARRAGVSSQDVAVSLQAALSGFETTELREKTDIIPIVMRSVGADRVDVSRIEGLNVTSQSTGVTVPLSQVADIELAFEASKIFRRDRLRTVTLSAELIPGLTATEVNAELVPWLEETAKDWEIGYRFELGGEVETSGEAQAEIGAQLPTAGMIIVLLLVGQFNSLRRPAIVLIAIPLGMIGVVLGLLVFRSYFGFMTLLGIVSLAGIVINNAIVLIEPIELEIHEMGREPHEAVVEAAQRRLRPILLTTATTVGGLLPLYLGGGPMWEPMAVAIMCGLLFATVLTLGVVPVLYTVFFRVRIPAAPKKSAA